MSYEIERKFLVTSTAWRLTADRGDRYCQGYLATSSGATARVRRAGNRGWLTIKGEGHGIVRREFEYAIPPDDAEAMLRELCEPPLISKTRYTVPFRSATWQVDVYEGDLAGLVVAEIELQSSDDRIEVPSWIGREVTHDRRFRNSNLARLSAPEARALCREVERTAGSETPADRWAGASHGMER